MNILFLSLSHIDSIYDEGIYMDLMHQFQCHGHNIYMVSPIERRYHERTSLINHKNFHLLRVKILNIQKTNILEKCISTLLIQKLFYNAICKYFKLINYDLIIYATPPITFSGIIKKLKKRDEVKTYLLLKDIFPQNAVDLNLFSSNSLIYKYFRKKEIDLYKISDYIGCMSPANVDYIIKHNVIDKCKVEVCPNSIIVRKSKISIYNKDLEILHRYGLPIDKTIFIYGGNLGKPQGLEFLLDIINSNRENGKIYFLIVGSGTEYSKFHLWFLNHRPVNAKLIHGLSKSDYDKLVAACDVGLILLDRRFTIPNYPSRLLSYLENGLPILAATDINTDIGRIAEENDFGYWCENGNLESFNRLINNYTKESIKRMGLNGYCYLRNNYSADKCYDIIMSHFVNH